jgi:hypothetical protein
VLTVLSVDRKESSKASLEKLGSFRALRSCDLGSVTQNSILTAISCCLSRSTTTAEGAGYNTPTETVLT